MSRAEDSLSDPSEFDSSDPGALLELPPAVLLPRRGSLVGATRRFGSTSATPPEVKADTAPAPSEAENAVVNEPEDERPYLKVAVGYVVLCFVFQLLLLIPSISIFRLPLRIGPFLLSLVLAMMPPRASRFRQRLHPAIYAGVFVMVVVTFGLLNAETEGMLSGSATVVFYACILAPVVWASRLQMSEKGLVRFVTVLWTFSTISCAVGALQVAFPGRFMPAMSTVIQQLEEQNGSKLTYQLANGQEIYRPFGLTDQPGGVVNDATIVFVFGIGLLGITRKPLLVAILAISLGLALFVTYMTQVRAALVFNAIAVVMYVVLLGIRGHFVRFVRVLTVIALIIAICTPLALKVGGSVIAERLFSLVAEDVGSVYYKNRGGFLEYTFMYALPLYPMGAGLGRYGMMAQYFSAEHGRGPRSLWVEIQWTAWTYDGGWIMIAAYVTAIGVALVISIRIMLDGKAGEISNWAAVLVSYNLSAVALTFSYALFMSQSGLQFWLLNGLLFAVYQTEKRRVVEEIPEGFEVVTRAWKPQGAPGAAATFDGPTPFSARRRLATKSTPVKVRAVFHDEPQNPEA